MSQSIPGMSGPSSYGLLGRLVTESAATRERLDAASAQVSSGMVSDQLSGLGSGLRTVLSLRPAMTAMASWQGNITAANIHADITLTAMDRINAIASDFYARTNNLNGLNTTNMDTTAAAARDALRELTGLLNTKDGDIYVFSGQDSTNPPVPDGDAILSSGFYTQIAASVASLSTAGAAATIAATMATAASNAVGTSPFSAFLSQPAAALQSQRATVEVAEQRHESFGILASANAVAVSGGPSTTGSYMRDVMRALATIGALSSTQIGDTGFAALVADTRDSLRNAITALNADAGIAGDARARMTQIHDQTGAALVSVTSRVASVEDVDLAAALSHLSQLQAQMQASYHMISTFSELSLVKYLA